MGIASSAGNIFFVYQFIKRLVTPFENTDAYKLGIIDEKGKVLRKRSTLKTKEEKEAYTISDTMVFNLKKILAKVPGGGTKFGTFTAALFLIKEQDSMQLGESISEANFGLISIDWDKNKIYLELK